MNADQGGGQLEVAHGQTQMRRMNTDQGKVKECRCRHVTARFGKEEGTGVLCLPKLHPNHIWVGC